MATQVVTVKSIERKSGSSKKGPWFFDIVETTGGAKFQTRFGAGFDGAHGETVELTYHEEEVERNGSSFVNNVIDSYSRATADAVSVNGNAAPSQDDRQTRIERQSTLKMAIDAARLFGMEDVTKTDLYDIADEFQRYVREGQDYTRTEEYQESERL